MTPWEGLADHWRSLGAELQVYDTITPQLDAPCVAIMPDDPWIEPNGFSIDRERYLAYAIAGTTEPATGQRQLHRLLHFIVANLPEGWDFVSAGSPGPREHNGATYLAAETRLTYDACSDGDPYAEGATTP